MPRTSIGLKSKRREGIGPKSHVPKSILLQSTPRSEFHFISVPKNGVGNPTFALRAHRDWAFSACNSGPVFGEILTFFDQKSFRNR